MRRVRECAAARKSEVKQWGQRQPFAVRPLQTRPSRRSTRGKEGTHLSKRVRFNEDPREKEEGRVLIYSRIEAKREG